MATSFPDELRLLLGPPTVALPSAMACHVFRSVIIGVIRDSTSDCCTSCFPSSIRYASGIQGPGTLGNTIVLGDSALIAGNITASQEKNVTIDIANQISDSTYRLFSLFLLYLPIQKHSVIILGENCTRLPELKEADER